MYNRNRRPSNESQGCLSGLMQLFLLNQIYDWCQRKFGAKSGSCLGCGCGVVILIIALMVFMSIVFKTDWTQIGF